MLTTLNRINSASTIRLQTDPLYSKFLLQEAIALFRKEPEVALVLFKEVILSRKITIGNNMNYTELITTFPPKVIKSNKQLDQNQQIVDWLLDKSNLNTDEEIYLELLGKLIYDYESKNLTPVKDIWGLELIINLVKEGITFQQLLNLPVKTFLPCRYGY